MTKTDREILENLDRQKLADTISLIRNIKIIEWGGGEPTGDKTEDGRDILSWPYPIYPDGVHEALLLLGTDKNYLRYADKLKDKDIDRMSLTELRRLFTYYFRGERFVDGLIAGFVEEGQMLKALERVEVIADRNKPE